MHKEFAENHIIVEYSDYLSPMISGKITNRIKGGLTPY